MYNIKEDNGKKVWGHLVAVLLLERAGFRLENGYEDTLNQYFLQYPEDEFLLELEFISSEANQSLHLLKMKCKDEYVSILCEQLKEICGSAAPEDFESCVCHLWQLLPPTARKELEQAEDIYREIFRDYLEGYDKIVIFKEYRAACPGSVAPAFEKAESLLGFKLHDSVRNFYSRVYAKRVKGQVNIPAEGFTIPIGNPRFDKWFSFNGIKGRTAFELFPCTDCGGSAESIRDGFTLWTGGNDFGERVLIGELFTGIGEISIVINNRTGAVEWVDCEYGQYEEYEKNPHGVLADHMDSFLQKLTGKTAGKAGKTRA